ncbi:MAG: hypothetical protein AB1700_13490 [Bacillota bacterium]
MNPDFAVMETVLTRKGVPPRVALYEHLVDDEIIEQVMGFELVARTAPRLKGIHSSSRRKNRQRACYGAASPGSSLEPPSDRTPAPTEATW